MCGFPSNSSFELKSMMTMMTTRTNPATTMAALPRLPRRDRMAAVSGRDERVESGKEAQPQDMVRRTGFPVLGNRERLHA
jgi:hypothetical protein